MSRGKRYQNIDRRKMYYVVGIGVFLILIAFIFALSLYQSKQEANSQISELENVTSSDATLVSTTEDRTINEVEEAEEENEISEIENIAVNTSNQTEETNNVTPDETIQEEEEEAVVELHFMVPLEGEIAKDYADSSLVYSETLQEWTVHLGVDIEAEKGSAVVASETGTVESIKNDPRYGTTVTIAHENGFKTIYSNLLSAEFVVEGQTVEKGETIGSVGDSAAFEIADNPHLHFEMRLNGENVNPSSYWE